MKAQMKKRNLRKKTLRMMLEQMNRKKIVLLKMKM